MTVAELIKELQKLDSNERIIVSVKDSETSDSPHMIFDRYHKGDIQEIAYHMNDNGNNAYALEVENSFVEYVRHIKE